MCTDLTGEVNCQAVKTKVCSVLGQPQVKTADLWAPLPVIRRGHSVSAAWLHAATRKETAQALDDKWSCTTCDGQR